MQINAIAGNIATDIKYDSEKQIAKFNVANDLYRGKNPDGSPKTETLYLPLVAFKNHAKVIADNCKKGDQLILEYEVSNNNYEKDSVKYYGFNFVITSVKFGKKV
jgi:single-stranded DNA-binding protein